MTCLPFQEVSPVLNGLALLIVAAGLIGRPALDNSLLVSCLAALGTVVKVRNDFQKFAFKVDMPRFAYTTYAKTFIKLRTYVCDVPLDHLGSFLIEMQTLDDAVTDFTPAISDQCSQEYARQFEATWDHIPNLISWEREDRGNCCEAFLDWATSVAEHD